MQLNQNTSFLTSFFYARVRYFYSYLSALFFFSNRTFLLVLSFFLWIVALHVHKTLKNVLRIIFPVRTCTWTLFFTGLMIPISSPYCLAYFFFFYFFFFCISFFFLYTSPRKKSRWRKMRTPLYYTLTNDICLRTSPLTFLILSLFFYFIFFLSLLHPSPFSFPVKKKCPCYVYSQPRLFLNLLKSFDLSLMHQVSIF